MIYFRLTVLSLHPISLTQVRHQRVKDWHQGGGLMQVLDLTLGVVPCQSLGMIEAKVPDNVSNIKCYLMNNKIALV